MKEFECTNTKNKVIINVAPMEDVQRLKQVILNELKKSPMGIKLTGDVNSLFEKELDFTGMIDFVKNTLIGIDTSEDFQDAVFNCLQYCTYKKVYKIDKELFDRKDVPEAREDYYEIIFACVEENLRPFIKSLISTWKTHIKNNSLTQLLSTM